MNQETNKPGPASGQSIDTSGVSRRSFLKKASAGNSGQEFQILKTYAIGPVVLVERYDIITGGGRGNAKIHVAGVLIVKDGKIASWRDYDIKD